MLSPGAMESYSGATVCDYPRIYGGTVLPVVMKKILGFQLI
jgi:hypothetical protein